MYSKDLHTSSQPASGFYLCVVHSSHMAADTPVYRAACFISVQTDSSCIISAACLTMCSMQ